MLRLFAYKIEMQHFYFSHSFAFRMPSDPAISSMCSSKRATKILNLIDFIRKGGGGGEATVRPRNVSVAVYTYHVITCQVRKTTVRVVMSMYSCNNQT